jgi:hypothetical protein
MAIINYHNGAPIDKAYKKTYYYISFLKKHYGPKGYLQARLFDMAAR